MIPRRLRTEYATEPLGINPGPVRVSWETDAASGHEQAAYRLEVAPSCAAFDDERTQVIETGWREDSCSIHVRLPGRFSSRERRWWRVQVRSTDGSISEWSDPTWFECGIEDSDFVGDWIAAPEQNETAPDPVPAIRRRLSVEGTVERARLYVAGLGSYVPTIDARRIGDREFEPAFSNYSQRVLYSTYDVTDHLTGDDHVLAFRLGRGWFAMATESSWGWHRAPWHRDRPRLLAQLEVTYATGEREVIETDERWQSRETPTQFDCLFAGETWDARLAEPDDWDSDPAWTPVAVVDGPAGELEPQVLPPMRETEVHEPISETAVADDTIVYEFPTMIVGGIAVSIAAPTGTEVSFRQGEKLDENGRVDVTQGFVDATIQTDTFLAGASEVESWTPQYSFKGFRYVEVGGLSDAVEIRSIRGRTVHTDIDTYDSEFRCRDDLLSRIHENARRGLRINYQGTPTDSPTYEKSSWTGDVQLSAEATMYNFDMANAHRKWLDDCADALTDDGELPPIVPTSGWGYEGGELGGLAGVLPGWDGVYALLPWWCYQFYGDQRFLEAHLDGMRRLVDYFHRHADGGVLTAGLGDWVPPGSGITADTMRPPEGPAISSTSYYYRTTEIVAEAADVLGSDDVARRYRDRAAMVRDAFHERFFDAQRGYYRTGEVDEFRQTSNVLPLAFGMAQSPHRESVIDALLADVEARDRHLNTGILGTKYVLPVLTDVGAVDVAFDVATRRTYPSWGRWLEEGATTLYESWELNSRSRNHRSLTSIEDWFYQCLAGIRPERPGFETVRIAPAHPQGLPGAGGTVETVRGSIRADWERRDGTLIYEIDLPANTDGIVTTPGAVDRIDGPGTAESDVTSDGRGETAIGPGTWVIRAEADAN